MYQNWGANTKVVSFEQEQFSEMNRDKIPDNTVWKLTIKQEKFYDKEDPLFPNLNQRWNSNKILFFYQINSQPF